MGQMMNCYACQHSLDHRENPLIDNYIGSLRVLYSCTVLRTSWLHFLLKINLSIELALWTPLYSTTHYYIKAANMFEKKCRMSFGVTRGG